MGPQWLASIMEWIGNHPGIAGLVIAVVAFLEGFAIIGILVPGIVILFGFGALVGLGVLELRSVWLWCSFGAIAGDAASFWIGRRYREHLPSVWPFSRYQDLIQQGIRFFRKHGLKSIIIGRFIGPVRPIMPVVAGMMNMPLNRYVPANIIAGILWAPAYLLPGVVFGASIELAKAVALRLALLVGLLVAIVWLSSFIVNRVYSLAQPRASRLLGGIGRWSRRHPVLGKPARALVDPRHPESGTLLLFAGVLIAAAWGLVTLLITVGVTSEPLAIDVLLQETMAELRSPWGDKLMASIAGFGAQIVLMPASAVVLIWLMVRRRMTAANHWAAAVIFGWMLALVIGYLFAAARPEEAVVLGRQIPVMHIANAVVVYGFFAIIVARELPGKRRVWPYGVATVLVLLTGTAHVYFAVYWFTDLLAGGFLGVLWISVLGLAYRRRTRRTFWMAPLSGLFFVTVILATCWHTAFYADRLAAQLRPEAKWKQVQLASFWNGQWQPSGSVPVPLNLQFAGKPVLLESALLADGWTLMPEVTWEIPFQMLQPAPDMQSLPVLPAAYAGKGEVLTVYRDDLALRLWPTRTRLFDGTPIYVGSVSRYEIKRVAWFFSYWSQQDDPDVLAAVSSTSDLLTERRIVENKPVLIIRQTEEWAEVSSTDPDAARAHDTQEATASEQAQAAEALQDDN